MELLFGIIALVVFVVAALTRIREIKPVKEI